MGEGDPQSLDERSPFAPPIKRSVTIAGHQTAISLEPIFWNMLKREAQASGIPVNALIAQIDVQRLSADSPPGLAGAVRCWLFKQLLDRHNAQTAE